MEGKFSSLVEILRISIHSLQLSLENVYNKETASTRVFLKTHPSAASLRLPLGLSFPRTLSGVLGCFFSVAGAMFDTDNQFDRI